MWKNLQAELKNKIRWSIGTSSASAGFNLSFQEQSALASLLADDVIAALKLSHESPDYRWDHEAFKTFLKREQASSGPSTSRANGKEPSPSALR